MKLNWVGASRLCAERSPDDAAEPASELVRVRGDVQELTWLAAFSTAALPAARPGSDLPMLRFLATDAPDRFARVAPIFLGEGICADCVELVDL